MVFFVVILVLLAAFYFFNKEEFKQISGFSGKNVKVSSNIVERVEKNYGAEVEKYAKEFNLPSSYLKALIALECSGRKPPGKRYEKHIFKRLKNLKDGKIAKYENIKTQDLSELGDDGLKNLATSWGPFQLMGYKCFLLKIYVADIRGSNSLYHGIRWINLTYGNYLRKGNFKDGFHIHNTGRPFPKNGKPKTYDPSYVERGLKYMEQFESLKTN